MWGINVYVLFPFSNDVEKDFEGIWYKLVGADKLFWIFWVEELM